MDNNVYFVYLTINKVNGKMYIGQHTCRYEDQFTDGYLGSGFALRRALKKYGEANFERIILEYAESPEELNELEAKYVDNEIVKGEQFYNLKTGGDKKCIYSEESKERISQTLKDKYANGMKNAMFGRQHSEKSKRKMSEAQKGKYVGINSPHWGKHRSEETKKKLHDKLSGRTGNWKGKKRSPEQIEKMREFGKTLVGVRNPFYGHTHTAETREKLRQANLGHASWNKGKKFSEESKKKMSEAHKGHNVGKDNPRSRKVRQYTLDGTFVREWECMREATKTTGILNISGVCLGKNSHAGGYIWKYAE